MHSCNRVRSRLGIPSSLLTASSRDIDCAFPSRDEPDDEDEEEPERDRNGNPIKHHPLMPPKSAVTLSGLLNVLDSVSSEEGRLTFATVRLSSYVYTIA